jgi:SpoVK/Ycf46/Vps4 family AAA+-type ATPase
MTEEKPKGVFDRIQTVTSIFNTAQSLYLRSSSWYKAKYLYTATLSEDAYIFPEIINYIDAQTNSRQFKFLSTRDEVHKFYNSDASAEFFVDGHKIMAEIYKPPGSEDGNGVMGIVQLKQSIKFTCKSEESLNALQNLMNQFTNNKKVSEKSNYLYSIGNYNDWDYKILPKKHLENVFLPEGEIETLLYDVSKFIDSEEVFVRLGLPWHRGYCLYGPPGNGKSSIALALANHFGLDLFVLSLSSIKNDLNLARMIDSVNSKSLLLIEDIDIFSKSMERKQEADSPTLAGLLNVLDGVSTPHGLITLITTNHFEKLDEALVRPGRVDYRLELTSPVDSQIEDMYKRFFGTDLDVQPKKFHSMAAVADVFKRNVEDPEAVRLELKES